MCSARCQRSGAPVRTAASNDGTRLTGHLSSQIKPFCFKEGEGSVDYLCGRLEA